MPRTLVMRPASAAAPATGNGNVKRKELTQHPTHRSRMAQQFVLAVPPLAELLLPVLIDAGANVNAATPDGTTPLHVAVQRGDDSALSKLLSAGANPNLADANGMLPVHWACALAASRNRDSMAPVLPWYLDAVLANATPGVGRKERT